MEREGEQEREREREHEVKLEHFQGEQLCHFQFYLLFKWEITLTEKNLEGMIFTVNVFSLGTGITFPDGIVCGRIYI